MVENAYRFRVVVSEEHRGIFQLWNAHVSGGWLWRNPWFRLTTQQLESTLNAPRIFIMANHCVDISVVVIAVKRFYDERTWSNRHELYVRVPTYLYEYNNNIPITYAKIVKDFGRGASRRDAYVYCVIGHVSNKKLGIFCELRSLCNRRKRNLIEKWMEKRK